LENSLFNKWCWENRISTCRRLKLDPYLSSCTKINSKWIKSLRSAIFKLLEENIWKTLEYIDSGNVFLNRTLIAQEIRARIDKWDGNKLKSFCYTSKETFTRVKRQSKERSKSASYLSAKGLISRIYKDDIKFKTLNLNQKQRNPISKWTNELNR
jgi:hypothetical protein